MAKDVTLSLRVDSKLSSKLEKEAKRSGRSKSSLAVWAIEQFLLTEEQEEALTRKALAESEAGGPSVSHDDMVAWLRSWGTDNELPPPTPKLKR